MSDGISGVYNRINEIRSGARNLRNFAKPQRVTEFEQYQAQRFQQMLEQANKTDKQNSATAETNTQSVQHSQNGGQTKTLIVNNIALPDYDNVYNENDSDQTKIDKTISAVSRRYHVSEDLIRSVIKQESGFNKNAVSWAGAEGLMQLMPQTAKDLDVTDSFDIFQNINGGVKYLRQMLDKYDNDLEKALAAYNAGPHRVDQANGVPNIRETINYVNKIRTNILKETDDKL